MKTLIIFATLFFGLLLSGCNSEKSILSEDDEFNTILSEIYNSDTEYFNITRSGEFIVNMDACSAIDEKVNQALEKYGISRNVGKSGSNYYNTPLTKANAEYELDIYDYLNYIDREATFAMKELINQIVVKDEIIELNSILNNSGLLPNEKIALVACCNFINFCTLNNPELITKTTEKECSEYYSIERDNCNKIATIGYTISICTAPYFGVGVIAALGTSALYNNCLNSAYKRLVVCLKYATNE